MESHNILIQPSGDIISPSMARWLTIMLEGGHEPSCIPCHFKERYHREINEAVVQQFVAESFVETDRPVPNGEIHVGEMDVPTGVYYDIVFDLRHQDSTFISHLRKDRHGRDIIPLERPRHAGHHMNSLPTTPVTAREGRPRTSHATTPPPVYNAMEGPLRQVDGPLPPHVPSHSLPAISPPGYYYLSPPRSILAERRGLSISPLDWEAELMSFTDQNDGRSSSSQYSPFQLTTPSPIPGTGTQDPDSQSRSPPRDMIDFDLLLPQEICPVCTRRVFFGEGEMVCVDCEQSYHTDCQVYSGWTGIVCPHCRMMDYMED